MSLSSNNENKLADLVWEIEAFQGEFRLILLRCNYVALRAQILNRLEKLKEIRIVHLQAGDISLHQRLLEELGEERPEAVVVLGFEVVEELGQFLNSANLNRDRLAQRFPLPVVFCLNEEIYRGLLRFAGDFESWGSSVDFFLTTEELLVTLRGGIEAVFVEVLGGRATDYPSCREILAASEEFVNQGEELGVELQRDLAFLRGQDLFTVGKYDEALQFYHQGLGELEGEKLQACRLQIGLCHFQKGEQATETEEVTHWQQAKEIWQQTPSPHLPISLKLAEVLHRLNAWQELAELLTSLNQLPPQPPEIRAQIQGFQALLALNRKQKEIAQTAAHEALNLIAQVPLEKQQEKSFYLLLLARAKQELGDYQGAFDCQKEALQLVATDHPKPYLTLLRQLRNYYFQQQEYASAFLTKQQRRSLEQQYGFRAFIGAGTIASQIVGKKSLTSLGKREAIAPEIIASGREEDVKALAARAGDTQHKLTIIYGESGVGKSSLVNGGLVPYLHSKSLGVQDALVVVLRVYTNWLQDLGELCTAALGAKGITLQIPLSSQEAIIQQLEQCEDANLRPVLIFDQFEEFFFLPTTPGEKDDFFRFVGSCLGIVPLKVVYSMRKDYLNEMLERPGLGAIGEDVLSKNVLYRVGNFPKATVPGIIRSLTERANFPLAPDLITPLVEDLAGERETIRPIELQIVGAQLQAEKITTLAQYEERGTKEALVEGYLKAVVEDCGPENEQLAELLLLLLTDEKGTRPLKTRGELTTELGALGRDLDGLDLVLEITVKSGLVLLVPEQPEERYQLVHDYLAEFIQEQQQPQLVKLQEDLAREREQRLLTEADLVEVKKVLAETQKETQVELAKAEEARAVLAKAQKKTARIMKVGVGVFAVTLLSSAVLTAFTAKKQREVVTGIRLERAGVAALQEFEFQQLEALVSAMEIGRELQRIVKNGQPLAEYPAVSPQLALQTILTNIREKNQLSHQDVVISAQFSPDGERIVTASDDRTAKVWDKKVSPFHSLEGHQDLVISAQFSQDGERIVTASDDRTAKVWGKGGNLLHSLDGHQFWVYSAQFSPNGERIVTSSYDGTAKVWDKGGKLLHSLEGHQDLVISAQFSPDGERIVTASDDRTAKVWDKGGKLLHSLEGHQDLVRSAQFSPDGERIVTASYDRTAKVWDKGGKLLHSLEEHQGVVYSAQFSPDGERIVTASYDGTAKVWNKGGKLLHSLEEHQGVVYSAQFSPDGERIVTASNDGTAKVWDKEGKLLHSLEEHQGVVYSAQFSPNGERIVTASNDHTAKVWDSQGREIASFENHQRAVNSAQFSPDGKYVVTASEDKTAKVWPVESLDELLNRGCDWLKAYLTSHPEKNVWEGGKLCPGVGELGN